MHIQSRNLPRIKSPNFVSQKSQCLGFAAHGFRHIVNNDLVTLRQGNLSRDHAPAKFPGNVKNINYMPIC